MRCIFVCLLAFPLLLQAQEREFNFKNAADYNGDAEFRDQTVNMIEYFRSTAANDFLRIVEILTKKELEQKDVNEVNAIINKCNSDHEQLSYNWNIASQDLLKRNVDKE